MDIQFGLNIVTLFMCIITLTLAIAALMPQIKTAIVLLRDGLLWASLFGVIALVGVVGWMRLHEVRQQRAQEAAQHREPQAYQTPNLQSEEQPARPVSAVNQPTMPVSLTPAATANTRTASQANRIRPNRSRSHVARRSSRLRSIP